MRALCRIRLLGDIRLVVGDKEITSFKSKKVAELIAYLSLNCKRISTREEIADLLWPEEDDDATRFNRLSNALSHVRSQVEPPDAKGSVVEANRFSVRFRPETVEVDVLKFRELIQLAAKAGDRDEKIEHLTQALQLYRGDFAPLLDNDWVQAERVRLQDAYMLLLADLRKYWEQAGDLSAAIRYGTMLLEVDAYSEPAYAALIRLHLAAGQETAARGLLTKLREVLEELDTEPTRETLAHFDSVPDWTPPKRAVKVDVPEVAEPLNTAETLSNKQGAVLPYHITRFFGRESEIEHAVQLLKEPSTRLVTLVGVGGSGKTRLAIEIARSLTEFYDENVFFVGFADVTNGRYALDAILAALGVSRQPTEQPIDQALARLQSLDSCLLIFDNLEHLLEDMVPIVQELLKGAPSLTMITTSRRLLGLSGEKEIAVPPLPLPDKEHELKSMMAVPSVALFVDRAQNVCTDFHLTSRNAPAIVELCKRLDGIPLALELAANWAKTLTPRQMLQEMSSRFDFLVTRRRDVPARHQKMLAIIESSYLQLEPEVREFFKKLGVFQGGWTVEAAKEVLDEPEAVRYLFELLERSLLTSMDQSEDTKRYGMLDTVRDFCNSQGETDALRLKHLEYYASHAERYGHDYFEYEMKMSHHEFVQELPNYRLALDVALQEKRYDLAVKLLSHTLEAWHAFGFVVELLEWLERIPTDDLDPLSQALVARAKGRCFGELAQPEALPHFETCLKLFRQLGETRGVAGTLGNLCLALYTCGKDEEAVAAIEEAVSLAKSNNYAPLLIRCLAIRASLFGVLGRSEFSGESAQKEIFELAVSENALYSAIRAAINLSSSETLNGNYADAERYCQTAFELLQKEPDALIEPLIHRNLGNISYAQGHFELAKAHYLNGLEVVAQTQDPQMFSRLLISLADVAISQSDPKHAIVLIYAAKSRYYGRALLRGSSMEPEASVNVEELAEQLGAREMQKAMQKGRNMSFSEAIRFAFTGSQEAAKVV